MNVITNAIDTLEEKFFSLSPDPSNTEAGAASSENCEELSGQTPTITVTTAIENGQVIIRIQDNGMGIAQNIRSRVFDQFFTTKPVGKGTGLGLAISHVIVTDKHKGKIDFESQVGKGTEFTIEIPQIA